MSNVIPLFANPERVVTVALFADEEPLELLVYEEQRDDAFVFIQSECGGFILVPGSDKDGWALTKEDAVKLANRILNTFGEI